MSSGVSLFALGPVAVAARSFLRRSERRLAVVAKATCKIVPDASLVQIAPRPIVASERFIGGPTSSLVHAGDLALRMPRAQILVVGAAYAEGAAPRTTATVRLAVARGEAMLVDKRLEIVGDRRGPARPSGLGGALLVEEASPFVRVPLVYERAFGGAGIARNPVGTGAHAGEDGLAALPNVHHAGGRIALDPAGFGPISSLWPARRELLRATSRQAADGDLDARLSDDFSDAYFVSAPSDQQLDAWQGGELIALFHLHRELAALRFHVPRWVASAVLQTARGVRVPVPMRLDTILVEPDGLEAELTYRGDIRVDEEALRGGRVAATLADEKVELPGLAERGAGAPADAFARGEAPGPSGSFAPPAARRAREATMVLEQPSATPAAGTEGAADAAHGASFEPRRTRAGTMVMESAPPPPPSPPPPPPPPPLAAPPPKRERAHAGTMILEVDPPPQRLPLSAPPGDDEDAPETQVMAVGEPRRARAATVSLDLEEAAPISLPFEKRERGEGRTAPSNPPLPGAPWSPTELPRPKPMQPGLTETIGLDDETAVDDAAPLAVGVPPARALPPPPLAVAHPEAGSAPPALPPVFDDKPRPLWREDPPEAVHAPIPNRKAPRSRVSFKSDLYKKIKK